MANDGDRVQTTVERSQVDVPRAAAIGAGIYAVAAGAVTLLGWILDSPRLADWIGSGIAMFPNTAVCAALSGVALVLLVSSRGHDWRRRAVRVLAFFAALIGGLTLFEHISGVNLGIDTLLFEARWGQRAAASPNRMGPPASASFLVLGLMLWLSTSGPRGRRFASAAATLPIAIASLSLIGYWFGADQLYTVVHLTGIAFQTSTVVAALAVGVIAGIPEYGLVALLSRDDAGGMLVRRVLLPVVVLPLLIGWLRLLGQQAGYYDTGFGISMMLLTTIAMLLVLLTWTALGISRAAQVAKQLDEQLRQRVEDLAAADRRKDEFLAILAHELRNPLAPIRTGLEVLKLTNGDVQTAGEVQRTMERQLQQLITLVDDLLDVSRITRGKLQLRKCDVSLAEVVQSAVEGSRSIIEEADHKLTVAIPESPIVVQADSCRLAQILSNLLNNAAKYTPAGGQIRLTAERQGMDVLLTVKDTGIGIPAGMQDRVFEMFTQLEQPPDKGHTGLGIGLTLVKSLVEMHGGRIEVHSAGPGQGSEFRVRLPIVIEPSLSEPRPFEDEATAVKQAGGLRILVVDDNKAAADLLSMVVRMLGNEVRTAYDGLHGVQAAAEFLPDVVLMDIGMPRMNGYEAARQIRRRAWGGKMVLVAVTGWGQDDDKQRAAESGFDHHLVKPADPDELQRLLSAVAAERNPLDLPLAGAL